MRKWLQSTLSWTLTLSLLSFALACKSQPEKLGCAQRDWYEIGRRDGSQGAAMDRQENYKKECGSDLSSELETIYNNGRNAGLVEFCQSENAFQMGRMGVAYLYVCPSTMEPQFLSGYRRGQQARQLEMKKRDLETQMDSLSQRLLALSESTSEKQKVASQLDELQKLHAANERELNKVSK